MRTKLLQIFALTVTTELVGCSNSNDAVPPGGEVGGANSVESTGGTRPAQQGGAGGNSTPATGGATARSTANTGGVTSNASGGAPSAGGTATGGAGIGGAATGGAKANGGTATGGGAATGGAKATGGANATGGVATGGVNAEGGAEAGGAATGGANATGGAATGGASALGGTGVGGAATGGAKATGGAGLGGAATGGVKATGGAATGGVKATGGAATGGAATGGATSCTPSANCTEADKTVTSGSGTHCCYTYENWIGSGSATMVLKTDGYSVNWTNNTQFVGREGIRPGSGNLVVTYSATFQPNGNSYLCVYGWTTSPLVEYYVVDGWGSWRPPGGTSLGTVTSDGGTYDIYKATRTNQPSIQGTATFPQYWSVRQQSKTSGTITLANHISAWAGKGMSMGTFYEVSMTVEGYQSSGTADVKFSIK